MLSHKYQTGALHHWASIRVAIVLALALVVLIAGQGRVLAARKSSMVVDGNTGKILQASNPDRLVYPASLTKMMTLFLVFDELERGRLSYKTRIPVSAKAARATPSKLGLKAGQTISVRNAIKALITKSANDVAIAVAEHIAGNEPAFARRMSAMARKLGMSRTVFKNASGLPDSDQVTTARDILKLAQALIRVHARYYHLFAMRAFKYKGHRYANHNGLLRNFRGTDGLKTGYTRASGFNLVASVRRGRKHVIGAVFGGKTAGRRNRRMRALLTTALKRASTRKSPAYERKTRDLIARLRPRRIPRPQLAKRNRAKPPQRIKIARGSSSQPKSPTRPRSSYSAPAALSRLSDPPIQVARVRPFRFGQQQSPSATPPRTGNANRYQMAALQPPARASEPTPPALPRTGIRSTNSHQTVIGRPPSTFQQQAALLSNTDRLQYSAPNQLRPAVLRSPLPAQARRPTGGDSYQVQIGAFGTVQEAEHRMQMVRASAGSLLNGYGTVTIPFHRANRRFIRARFSGFSKSSAAATCQQLRSRKVDCFVAKAR